MLCSGVCLQRVFHSLSLIGGATESIFPQVEALLMQGEYSEAIEFIARNKQTNKYRSVMDFLFCELNPSWRKPCRQFYAGIGPQLKDIITTAQLEEFNGMLLLALSIALNDYNTIEDIGWGRYRKHVNEAIRLGV